MKNRIENFLKNDRGALNIQHTPVLIAVAIAAGFLLWLAANNLLA